MSRLVFARESDGCCPKSGTQRGEASPNRFGLTTPREAFGDLEIVKLVSRDAVIREGSAHNGMSALIDIVARKQA